MKPTLRLSPQTLQVLDAFLVSPKEWKYGYDISRNTGLKSGTLYPILMRMADRKLLETSWETTEPGRPPRHMYRFTAEGMRLAREHRVSRTTVRVPHTAFTRAINPFTAAIAAFTRVIGSFTGTIDAGAND